MQRQVADVVRVDLKASLIIAARLALSVSDWIALVSWSTLGLQ